MLNQKELQQILAALKPMTVYRYDGKALVSLTEVIEIVNSHAEGELSIGIEGIVIEGKLCK